MSVLPALGRRPAARSFGHRSPRLASEAEHGAHDHRRAATSAGLSDGRWRRDRRAGGDHGADRGREAPDDGRGCSRAGASFDACTMAALPTPTGIAATAVPLPSASMTQQRQRGDHDAGQVPGDRPAMPSLPPPTMKNEAQAMKITQTGNGQDGWVISVATPPSTPMLIDKASSWRMAIYSSDAGFATTRRVFVRECGQVIVGPMMDGREWEPWRGGFALGSVARFRLSYFVSYDSNVGRRASSGAIPENVLAGGPRRPQFVGDQLGRLQRAIHQWRFRLSRFMARLHGRINDIRN